MVVKGYQPGVRGDGKSAQVPEPAPSVLNKLDREDRERLLRILSEPLEYQAHDSFGKIGTLEKLFGHKDGAARAIQPWCNAAAADARPCDESTAPVATLSTAEEQRLFLRFNYARYRIVALLQAFTHKRLTAPAVREILWWHRQMVSARCQIVQANVPLVLAMAKRTRLPNADYAELISEGNMALLRSVDKFDCSRGFKFSTYACRAILKAFSRVALRASRYRGRFPTEFDPTLEKSDYQDLQRDQVEAACVEALRAILERNAADLNDVEFRVLQARFALGTPEGGKPRSPQTLEQVGLLIGVTKERVRQIQNRALAKLRAKLQEDYLAA